MTAFAVGHSITLAALAYVALPSRLVESLIALSILVAGVHAINPSSPAAKHDRHRIRAHARLAFATLLVLSRTRAYPAAHVTVAGFGIVLAAARLAERTTPIPNPLNRISDTFIAHPFVAVAAAALAGRRRSAQLNGRKCQGWGRPSS